MTIISTNNIKLLLLPATLLFAVSCANQSSLIAEKQPSEASFNNIVHGKIIADDTRQPIAGATVYVPKSLSSSGESLTESQKTQPLADLSLIATIEKSMGCKVPREPYTSFACTDRLGNFTIPLINNSLDNVQLKFQYNQTTNNTEITLNDLDSDLGTILFSKNPTQSQKEKIAIVLDMGGKISSMQNTPDKFFPLPMKVEFQQQFVKMYDIDENQYDVEFIPFLSLFEDKDADHAVDIFKYKIVYLITAGDEELSDIGKDRKSTLLEFISKGGELYVTTLSVELDEPSLDEYI